MKQIKETKIRKQVNLTIDKCLQEKINNFTQNKSYITFAGLCSTALEAYIDGKTCQRAKNEEKKEDVYGENDIV